METEDVRKPGFYWVYDVDEDDPFVGEWTSYGKWLSPGTAEPAEDGDFVVISGPLEPR